MIHPHPFTFRSVTAGACLFTMISACSCQQLKSGDDRAPAGGRDGLGGLRAGGGAQGTGALGGGAPAKTDADERSAGSGGAESGLAGTGVAGAGRQAPTAGDSTVGDGSEGAGGASGLLPLGGWGGTHYLDSAGDAGSGGQGQHANPGQGGGTQTAPGAAVETGAYPSVGGRAGDRADAGGATSGLGGSGQGSKAGLGGGESRPGGGAGLGGKAGLGASGWANGGIDTTASDGASATGAEPGSMDLHIDDLPDGTAPGPISLAPTATPWLGTINVCFHPSNGKDTGFSQAQQDLIRRVVTDSWARVAYIQLQDFGPCLGSPSARGDVRITLDTSLPTGVIGSVDTLGQPNEPDAFSVVSFSTPTPSARAIIHLFGHVLGFSHPQESPCDPDAGAAGASAQLSQSVMSQSPCHAASTLTPVDIVAVQNAYSRHAAGNLVGMNGLCLDAPVPPDPYRTAVMTYSCHDGAENQQWRMYADGMFTSPPCCSGYVLDVFDANPGEGMLVSLYESSAAPKENQIWRFDQVQVRGIGDLCLDRAGADAHPGQYLEIQTCNGNASQNWVVEWTSTNAVQVVSVGSSTLCVKAPESSGERLVLALCDDGSPNQVFEMTALGELRYGGRCWGSEGGDPQPGRAMLLEDCLPDGTGKRHQQFFLRARLLNGLGKCLTAATSDFKKRDLLYSYSCAGTPDFIWDYYFNPE